MFIKICGFSFVILSCGLIGLKMSKDYVTRIEYLEELKKIVNVLKNEIAYSNAAIVEAIKKSAISKKQDINDFLDEVAEIYENSNVSINEAWNMSKKNKLSDNGVFKDMDIELIEQIGNNLGITCRATQIDNLDLHISKIQLLIDELNKPKNEKCKMYKTMGVMTGLLIVIMFV